jgi:hypothetical protein
MVKKEIKLQGRRFHKCFICGEIVEGWRENYCMKHETIPTDFMLTACTGSRDWGTIMENLEKGVEDSRDTDE